jgi:hypothetical protein
LVFSEKRSEDILPIVTVDDTLCQEALLAMFSEDKVHQSTIMFLPASSGRSWFASENVDVTIVVQKKREPLNTPHIFGDALIITKQNIKTKQTKKKQKQKKKKGRKKKKETGRSGI